LVTAGSKRSTFIGTPYWMAPEVAQPVPNYDTRADIWSLGIMIWEMLKGTPPHSHLMAPQVLQIIPRSKAPRLAENDGSKDLRDFVAMCLQEQPGEVNIAIPRSDDECVLTKPIASSCRRVV
jgi:serine/threonine protein kinase